MNGHRLLIALFLFVSAWPTLGIAQDSQWNHTITPYLMGAYIDGTTGIGPLDADVDLSASDIFSNLDFGAMFAYRGETENWAVMTDFIYMKLGASQTGPRDNVRAQIELDQTVVQLDVARRLSDHVEVTLGTRYWDVESAVRLTGSGPLGIDVRAEAGESWFDPLIGMRVTWPISANWTLLGKGDVGGFGVGSDFTWHASVAAHWASSERIGVAIFYRHIYVDYESGTGPSRFALDVTEAGPGVGVSFKF